MGKEAAPGTEEPAPQKDQPKDAPGTAVGADISVAPGGAMPPQNTGPKAAKGKHDKVENQGSPVGFDPARNALSYTNKSTVDEHDASEDVNRPDKQHGNSTSVAISPTGIGGKDVTSTKENGKTKQTSSGANYNFATGGIDVETGDVETTGEGETAKSKGTKKSGSLDATGASYKKTAVGDGASYGGKIGPDGVSGTAAYTVGETTIDVGAGITLKVVGPIESGTVITVSVTRTANIKGGLGNATATGSRGASGSVAGSNSQTITREFPVTFEGRAKATKFAKSTGTKFEGLFQTAAFGKEASARKLELGETRTFAEQGTAAASGSVTAEGVTASIGGSVSSGNSSSIKRIDANVFEVTRTSEGGSGKEGGLAAAGVGGAYATSSSEKSSITYRFDLSDPTQAREYESYVTSRTPPQSVKPFAKSDGKTEGDATTIKLPFMSATDGGKVSETDSVDADGKRWKEIIGEHSMSWASTLTADKHASNQSFRAMIDQATGTAVYGISATAGGTDGSANQRELGLATDTGTSGRDGVAASGDWTVTTYFTEAEIDAISSAIVRGKGTTGALPSTAGAGEILRASLAKAHDTNAQARAIANYVKATGPKGLGALRSMAGLDTNKQRDEIALVPKSGTNPFLGPDGKAKLQAKMVEFQRRIDSPEQRSSIAKDISGELVGLDVRLNDLRHDKFPDLPVNLLIEERDRVSGFITVLEAMRATTAVTSDDDAAKAEARLDGSTLASLAGLGEAAERCAGQSSRAQSAFTSCRKRYYRHIETTDNGTRSMRSEFAGYYEKIDPNYAMAVAALDAGYMMSRHLEAKSFALAEKISNHATLADIKTLAGEIATYSDGLAKGYARAADLFVNVSSQLDVVWDKWSDSFTNPIDTTPKGI